MPRECGYYATAHCLEDCPSYSACTTFPRESLRNQGVEESVFIDLEKLLDDMGAPTTSIRKAYDLLQKVIDDVDSAKGVLVVIRDGSELDGVYGRTTDAPQNDNADFLIEIGPGRNIALPRRKFEAVGTRQS